MAWREITVGETRWAVAPVAERVAHTQAWRLVLSCRCAGEPPVLPYLGGIAPTSRYVRTVTHFASASQG